MRRTRSQRLHDELDKLCGDIVKERDGWRCRRCGADRDHGAVIQWAHIIRRSRSKAVRWNIDNGISLCNSCHVWLDRSADRIQAAFFVEKMIGKKKMEKLHELANDKNAKSWLVCNLEEKLRELSSNI